MTKNDQSCRIKKKRNRRILGSRKYKDYTKDMLELAVEMVSKKIISSREAEKQFGIPRRTILNKGKKKHMKPVGGQKKLADEEEENLVKVLTASADYGSPMTKLDLKMLVYKYLQKNSRTDIFHDKLPGDTWVEHFLKRHSSNLTIRATQNIKRVRAEKGLMEMELFFNNLQETLKDVPPANILNYDETNLADNPGAAKCIFRRGIKYPERLMNTTKSCISIMFTACASGTCLPTYVVYKATHLYSEWVEGGPDGTRYNCTKSGWFDSSTFEDYFKTIVVDWAKNVPGPKVVIGDNLSSHLNIEVVELCQKYDIRFVFLPPNSTHLTQPLDVAYFAPLKKEWKKILLEYKIKNPNQTTLNKKHFPKLLSTLTENIKLREASNIKSGFRATGICPVNARSVLKRLPEYFEDTKYDIDTTLLDYLKETRAPNPMQIKRSKKLHTEPGKSVCVGDIVTTSHNPKITQKKTPRSNLTYSKNRVEDNIDISDPGQNHVLEQKRFKITKNSLKNKNKKPNRRISIENSRAEIENETLEEIARLDEKYEGCMETALENEIYILDDKTGEMRRNTFKITKSSLKNKNKISNRRISIENSRTEIDKKIVEEIDRLDKNYDGYMDTAQENETLILDDKTGEMTRKSIKSKTVPDLTNDGRTKSILSEHDMPSTSTDNISSDQSVLLPLSSSLIHNPDCLKKLCIQIINIHLGSSEQETITQSSYYVCPLNESLKSHNQNLAFISNNKTDLPICLQPPSKVLSTNSSSALAIVSDVIVTSNVKVTSARKKNIIKEKLKGCEIIIQPARQIKLFSKKKVTNIQEDSAPREPEVNNENTSMLIKTEKIKQANATTGKKTHCGKETETYINISKKAKVKKQTVQNKRARACIIESSSENSDILSLADTDESEYETFDDYITACLEDQAEKENTEPYIPFGISDISYFTDNVNDLKKDDWVVAKFATKKSLKHFVGQVLCIKNNVPTIKFVRKVGNSKGIKKLTFTYPNVEDVCEMTHLDDVILLLPQPNISRRGQIIFDINLSKYNIQ